MRCARLTLFVAAAAIVAAPSFAADPAQPADGTHAAKPKKEKKICRREPDTGSIMLRSTCRTQSEWDELSAQGQDSLRTMQDRSSSTMGSVQGN